MDWTVEGTLGGNRIGPGGGMHFELVSYVISVSVALEMCSTTLAKGVVRSFYPYGVRDRFH